MKVIGAIFLIESEGYIGAFKMTEPTEEQIELKCKLGHVTKIAAVVTLTGNHNQPVYLGISDKDKLIVPATSFAFPEGSQAEVIAPGSSLVGEIEPL